MKNIVYPSAFFDRPFAETGNKQIIPENQGTSGRASLVNGFPTETQLPLNQGGIAPNRLDFNGAFYMLSAMAFWQQSGGQWQWNASLNYTTPCLVFSSNKLWWCIQNNGPNTSGGVRDPGSSPAYWKDFLQALADMAGGGGGGGDEDGLVGNPIGTIIMFYGITSPIGYLSCDGSSFSVSTYPKLYQVLGKANTPDMRGLFVRGYDPAAINDPDGDSRSIGSFQNDSANTSGIIGTVRINTQDARVPPDTTGSFSTVLAPPSPSAPGLLVAPEEQAARPFFLTLDSSGSQDPGITKETRPKNINLLYCIRHD